MAPICCYRDGEVFFLRDRSWVLAMSRHWLLGLDGARSLGAAALAGRVRRSIAG